MSPSGSQEERTGPPQARTWVAGQVPFVRRGVHARTLVGEDRAEQVRARLGERSVRLCRLERFPGQDAKLHEL